MPLNFHHRRIEDPLPGLCRVYTGPQITWMTLTKSRGAGGRS